MALVTAFGGWAVFRLSRRLLPSTATGVAVAGAIAALVSVVLSSVAFSIEWLFGASVPVPFDRVFGAMVGVHVLIAAGEAVITGLVLASVLAARPDLVRGADGLRASRRPVGRSLRPFLITAAVVTVLVAGGVAQFAADEPDGLERVAEDTGFASAAEDHPFGSSVFADYATRGVRSESVSLAIAGVGGALLTLAVGSGLFLAIRRRGADAEPATVPAA
jgi:cobalt/nickel transport system permease protein